MKAFLMSLLTKVGVSTSGVFGWLFSIIVDRFIIWAEKQGRLALLSLKEFLRQKSQQKIDEKNEQQYQEGISDESGITQEQLDQNTSDLLNGRRP